MTVERVGFVGLGIMGAPMAANLVTAGFEVTVWNRSPGRSAELEKLDASVGDSPADVAAASEIVVSCVTDSSDVEAVALGPSGIIEGGVEGLHYVDCSTIAPETARSVAATLKGHGIEMLDAPISGGDVGARAGTLAIMVGGEPAAFETVLPVLEAMGSTIVLCGPSGAGQVVKLCNQAAAGLNLLAMSEAIAIARRAGVDPEKMLEVVGSGAAGSWMLQNLAPRAVRGDYSPGFMVELMQKDMRLVLETAAATNTPLPGSALVQQLFRMLEARGRGKDGTQAIVDAVAMLSE